jgi:SAM-dependent methyltransferase
MLQEAQKLAVAKGYSNLVTQLADAEALPFADATFDLVTCRIAPHHFPDIAQFVSEVRRVSKSGGTFALVDNVAPDIDTSPGFSESELREADLAYNAFEKMRDPSHGRALTTRAWIAIVEDAGLRITHCEHQAKDMDFTNWCKTMNVSPEIVQKLRASLLGAPPALKAFLQPGDRNGSLGFTLAELILIAKKP